MSSFSLESCLEVCTFLKSLITKSFGPNGQTSLILTTTGHATITNCGLTILEAANCSHPVARIILKALLSHYTSSGDGSKTFILLTEELLKNIIKWAQKNKSMKNEMIKSFLSREFYKLLHLVLPECFIALRTKSYCHHTIVDSSNVKNIEEAYFTLLKSFFCGKFAKFVSKQLTTLCKNFISHSQKDWNGFSTGIGQLLQYFDMLCTCIEGISLKESKIIKGILIQRNFTVSPKDCNGNQKFIMILENSELDDNVTKTAVYDISDVPQLSKILNWDIHHCVKIINNIKQLGVTMILSCCGIPDILVALCKQNYIGVITMIPKEEIEFLAVVTNVKCLYSFEDEVSEKNIGNFKSIVSLILGNQVYIHISLETYHRYLIPHHLILYGPTKELCKQYFQSCKDSIKLLVLWLKEVNIGNIEYNVRTKLDHDGLSNKQSDVYNLSQAEKSMPIDYFQNLHKFNANFKNEDLITSAYPTGGFWELCLQAELRTRSQQTCLEAGQIFGDSLIIVSKLLHENSYSGKNNFISLLTQIKKGIMSDDLTLLDGHKGTLSCLNNNSLEPVTLKEMVVYHVIQLVIQLLRIIKVVSISKLHHDEDYKSKNKLC